MTQFAFPLPIDDVLDDVIQKMRQHTQCVLQAPPGAGKTTRIPIALESAEIFSGKILMLEPRRLAARGAATRLAQHYGDALGQTVGYRMRGDSKTSAITKIEVITEGILTRMIQSDPELTGVSCVIFDEFHERSLNADLGLALCLEIRTALRDDLAILVMSATLDAAPVAALMGDAPIVTSQGKSYPVTPHHLARPWAQPNQRGYGFVQAMAALIETAAAETTGSILAFLPGEGEIRRVQALLEPRLKPIHIHPLFGAMPFADQRRAIEPSTSRKLVLATSIAETSLTIEDIRVVVDGGQARRARFDAGSGMSRLVTERVTRAEATQRMGRAGRVSAGTCYKMWTKGEEGGLLPFAPPEIHSSDLSALVLELAAWGTDDPSAMPFLDQPRPTDFSAAQDVLRQLGALDQGNRLTKAGEEMARLPVHPRMAKVLLSAQREAPRAVALMEARDILTSADSGDLTLRWKALNNPREVPRVNLAARKRVLETAKRLKGTGTDNLSLAQMAALAYPDRIGLRRTGKGARYLLSGGRGAEVADGDPLGASRMIVATDLDGGGANARLRLGIAITEAEVLGLYPERIETRQRCIWSKRERRVLAQEEVCFGALVLSAKNWKDCDGAAIGAAMLDGVLDLGLDCLPWSKASRLYLARINRLVSEGADLPDCSPDALALRAQEWLLPHLSGIKTMDALAKLDMGMIVQGLLDWGQNELLNQLAPAHILAPTGTKLMVDYASEPPRISVRLQELFGMTTHPTIGPKRTALLIELLSPAHRPVQTTADLPNFWATSYADVRKDMRGRYPRHPWPENPAEAEPTRRVKHPRKR
ncbi:DEAD/DEAH box helicase [Amylibacter marinus]|uniref:DEAD/DEAH box helicase n=1 Tax=Amylibacter marinus TaxID=1475483 RepID=A0ABQ5VR54_9RHOB|nr:ATP-dependent helicase HrpB [Amylibacter marinus]GLQ33890.1 DEAD/DEAH box helicase [Amylibacter marinus]